MQYPRICLCAMLVCLFSCFGTVMGQDTIDLKSLADSVRKANGKPNFLPLGMHFLELAKERKDTANISDAVHPANDRKRDAGRGDEGDGFTLQRRRETER